MSCYVAVSINFFYSSYCYSFVAISYYFLTCENDLIDSCYLSCCILLYITFMSFPFYLGCYFSLICLIRFMSRLMTASLIICCLQIFLFFFVTKFGLIISSYMTD